LVIVVVQNGGGQIFAQLPLAGRRELGQHFQDLFLMPQAVDVAALAQAFGIAFHRVHSEGELGRALGAALVPPAGAGCSIVGAVARPRLPGHGLSPSPLPGSFDAAVDELAAKLAPPTWIVGYSMGARLGLALALRHPERCRGALLVGAQPGLRGAEGAARRA